MIDQSRRIYFSPTDQTTEAFLAFVGTATQKIRIADYSFNMAPLVDLLLAKFKARLDVKLVLDKSQAAGATERPVVEELRQAGVPLMVGTSSMHKIMHSKYCILDDQSVEYGSWNMTNAASSESNFLVFESNPDMAGVFNANWEAVWAWIAANEPQMP